MKSDNQASGKGDLRRMVDNSVRMVMSAVLDSKDSDSTAVKKVHPLGIIEKTFFF